MLRYRFRYRPRLTTRATNTGEPMIGFDALFGVGTCWAAYVALAGIDRLAYRWHLRRIGRSEWSRGIVTRRVRRRYRALIEDMPTGAQVPLTDRTGAVVGWFEVEHR